MIFYGYHTCIAALINPKRSIEKIYLTKEKFINEIPEHQRNKIKIIKNLEEITGENTNHQGIAISITNSRAEIDFDLINKIVILDQITDPHNVGAIIRSCAVFGVDLVVMQEKHSPKDLGVIAKVASGALEHLELSYEVNLSRFIENIKKINFWSIALAEGGTNQIHKVDLSGKIAIVIGSEENGIRKLILKHCDIIAQIPTSNKFSTLNASNAAAITLYEIFKKNFTLK